jgi:hypothetical protein
MFFRLLKRSFWVFYDNLLKGIVLNFILFLITFAFVFFGIKFRLYLLLAAGVMLSWHIMAPAFIYYWSKLIATGEPEDGIVKTVIEGLRLFSLKGLLIFLLNGAFAAVAFMSFEFYKNMAQYGKWVYAIGGIGIWLAIVFLMMQVFLIPIMVLDEKRRVFVSYKKALIMLMSAPFTTMTTATLFAYLFMAFYPLIHIQGAHPPELLALATLFPIFLVPFVTFSAVMVTQTNFVILIYEKHKIMPSLNEMWEEDRGLKSLFRPWENKK